MKRETRKPSKIGEVTVTSEAQNRDSDRKKTKKPYGRGKPSVKEAMIDKVNDAVFFTRNPQLTKDTTNIPFAFKNGLVTRGPTITNSNQTITTDFHMPSVVCLNYDHLLGGNKDKNSLNTIANNLYSYVRYVNSGSRNYESPDLFMYFGAISSAYGLAAFIAKCIGLTNVASPINRAYPRQVFAAMNVNFGDAIQNIANYRARLNSCIIRLNAYNVPAKFYCYLEHIWCASILYIESTNGKDQIYTSRPLSVLAFDGTTAASGSILKLVSLENNLTIGDYLLSLESLILALETDEDIGIMSGDVLKAMGSENCFHMGTVSEDYVALPTYDENMLLKIKNIRIPLAHVSASKINYSFFPAAHDLGTPNGWLDGYNANAAVYWQVQTPNAASQIQFSYGLATTNTSMQQFQIMDTLTLGLIDSKSEAPTEDEINENVCFRFAFNTVGFGTSNYTGYPVDIAGLALFRKLSIVRYSDTTQDWVVEENLSNFMIGDDSAQTSEIYSLSALHDLITFDYLHGRYASIKLASGVWSSLVQDKWMGEFSNIHLLTREELANIIDAQLLSEFAVPAVEHLGKAASYAK